MGQQVIRQASHKLSHTLRDTKQGVRQLSTGNTEYIVDPTSGDCQAIIGNLGADNLGNETGLSGWGIAINSADGWQSFSLASGWIDITSFTNGYGQASGGSQVAYRRDSLGMVCLTGELSVGTPNTSAFTLPAGFRPGSLKQFAVSGVGVVAQTAQVQTGGTVVLFPNSQTTLYLDNVAFLAEQ